MDPQPIVSCPDVDQNLWRYIDRELSASALAAISSHLRVCESCQGLYHERARDASHYRMVFVDSPFGEPFVVKLKRRLRQETPASAGGASCRRRPTAFFSLRHRKVRRALAVAAMLVLIPVVILIGLVQKSSEGGWLGSFQASVSGQTEDPSNEGKVFLISQDRTREGSVSLPLQARGSYGPGDGIEVPQGVKVSLDYKESVITLQGPAFLRVDVNSTRDQFIGYLEKGKLRAEVARLIPPHQAFTIRTEHAVATVVGTRFTVHAREAETLLEVEEGKVKFQSAWARPGVDGEFVEAGETYRMRRKAQSPEEVVDEASGEVSLEAPEQSVSPAAATPASPGAGSSIESAEPEPTEAAPAVNPAAPTAVEPAPAEEPPAKSGDGTPNADLDQPVTR